MRAQLFETLLLLPAWEYLRDGFLIPPRSAKHICTQAAPLPAVSIMHHLSSYRLLPCSQDSRCCGVKVFGNSTATWAGLDFARNQLCSPSCLHMQVSKASRIIPVRHPLASRFQDLSSSMRGGCSLPVLTGACKCLVTSVCLISTSCPPRSHVDLPIKHAA